MWLPRSQTHPAEVSLAGLVLADHVIATSVLLDCSSALGTLLGVGRDPVGGFTVVITLLDPLLDQVTPDWVVPILTTGETKHVRTPTFDRLRLDVHNFDCMTAVRTGTPSEQSVALDEAVGDQMLVLEFHLGVADQVHHCLIIDNYVATARTFYHLTRTLVHDLGGEVLSPATGAVEMTTL